eukprot:677915-Lingulodinium_polyedra.AAC.1
MRATHVVEQLRGTPEASTEEGFVLAAEAAGCRNGDWSHNTHERCPLCGAGEAGSEHLIQWCPA